MPATRRPRRYPWALLLLVLTAAVVLYRVARDPWPAEQGVKVPAGEDTETARVIASTVAAVDAAHQAGRPHTREAFAKAHACLRATVSVLDVEPRLRQGLFARRADYRAWIRLSSGAARVRSDQMRDARGLALKLTGVPGRKLLLGEEDAPTQDFVLADTPRFFVPDVAEYALYADAVAHGGENGFFFGDSWDPRSWRLRALYLATRARRAPPGSLLQTAYFSQTAYRLGSSLYVKYAVRPCEPRRPPRQNRTDDMLRREVEEELRQADGCFELAVQPQVEGRDMPVEDATVLWSESDSPFLPVARVTIPRQSFASAEQDRFCEALSFTPWHALAEHEPVGGINRLRQAVYRELSRYRHARNRAPLAEPRGWCLDLTGAPCPDEAVAPAGSASAGPPPAAAPTPAPTPSLPPASRPTPKPTPSPTATPEAPPTEEAVPNATQPEQPPPLPLGTRRQ